MWDSAKRFGGISRALHWTCAFLILWQLAGGLGRHFPIIDGIALTLFGFHTQIGVALCVLILARCLWRAVNILRQAKRNEEKENIAVLIGHALLYLSMVVMPVTGLVLAWSWGESFAPFGFEIFTTREPGDLSYAIGDMAMNVHSIFGWLFAFLVGGHIFMALFHQFVLKDFVLRKIA